ncbi:hypothetical protein AB0C77_13825 [Streptomyces sp. NPDC048629]|uniref:hypothetical protein n=1 Tax=Streptomyces sp. NPDC048629 TaxID=3154824 RepID=UPI0034241B5D
MSGDTGPSPLAGAEVAQLQRLIEALTQADPQAYFDAAQSLDDLGPLLLQVAQLIEERSDWIFEGVRDGGRWEGEAARTAQEAVDRLTRRLRELAESTEPWAAETDSAGEAISNAWREVNDILARGAT